MHPHSQLLHKLFQSLARRDAEGIAQCYHPEATFRDIAFDLRGKMEIRDMWRMICVSDIHITFDVVRADDSAGLVKLIDEYTFSDTGRPVRNVIDSHFAFRDHLVIEHRDVCDPHAWGEMALGGMSGFLAGRVGPLRRMKARRKLQAFVASHAHL